MHALRRVANQGGPPNSRRTAIALARATMQLVANATSSCVACIPMRTSATTWARNAAAMKTGQRRSGTSSNAQNRMTLGGQNSANILSDSVPK